MIIVSDTSPLNYLVLVECVHILPVLYSRIVIPEGVLNELQRASTPEMVRGWFANRPEWIDVRKVIVPTDPDLELFGIGEREAIALAQELQAAAIIIDEDQGRKEAKRRGLPVIGLLGILRDAADRQLLDLPVVIEQLRKTSFRCSEKLYESLLQREAERKKTQNE